ncbi:MAG: NADH:flavin oxidoreductase [Treponema sp.]|nr:NADH:flavin oxidoreductase [Treponema sp.]
MTNPGSPIKIGKKIVKNRITMAPTVKFYAGDDGLVTEDYVKHYEERAAHECGFICVEATCVAKEARLFPTQLGIWNDEQIEGHRKIAEACHKYGAIVVPQIHYGGLGTHPACGPLTSPTKTMWNNGKTEVEAIELTKEDILRIEGEFVAAAVRAKKAGYDGVQLHACHSYLINDFASAVNKRTDEYGGSLENMARFGCEIISGIRKTCGEDFIISARVSGCEPDVEGAIQIAEYYVAAGCDYLQVSCGIYGLEEVPHDESLPYNKIASLGVIFHEHFKGRVPVSCVNGLRTVEVVNYLFENDLIDTVDLACGLLADPAFSEAILHGTPYQKCLNCKDCGFGPMHSHVCGAMLKRGACEFASYRK